ncbi:unnamed protein product [Darwinula stevensoni]|uniref:Hydroxymethylglutaryl-CoA synthase n=1 Tax=Darwinula stevensoni TaxID=69355 RepID=A0A7R8X3N1_9CRUS|nr:unnamed protein product [Darwinula stevensoni]CAG0878854.1 unnamed protein product [Darwinula stevensoni]
MPNASGGKWPVDVGIHAISLYFPSQFVKQDALEEYDGVSSGKYTIGLGQTEMGFCSDREDINSLFLTVTHRLLKEYDIDVCNIGYLAVGSETILDKAKSIKSVLMQIWDWHGVDPIDVEGVDSVSACYGGTAALFNAINWIESSSWNGKQALVVTADIAVYASGNARPTGGAGAVAMLIGPCAPIVFERGTRSTYMEHAYDFYKPNLSSEYPVVDGKLSVLCYLRALDKCYQLFCEKSETLGFKDPKTGQHALSCLNALVFHSPYCRLVEKSVARLYFNDLLRCASDENLPVDIQHLGKLRLEDTYFDKELEKQLLSLSRPVFQDLTETSLLVAKHVGNMYCPSVYACLASSLLGKSLIELSGMRIGIFSYGSGFTSSMFSVRIAKDGEPSFVPLKKMHSLLSKIPSCLGSRILRSPEYFTRAVEKWDLIAHQAPFDPNDPVEELAKGTWYLVSVDDRHRRKYAYHSDESSNGA